MCCLPVRSLLTLGLFVTSVCTVAAAPACPPPDWPLSALKQLKQDKWHLPDDTRRETLATALLPCLIDANPELRDRLAFEALSAWMRAKQLSETTRRLIYQSQLAQLNDAAPDPAGFAKPFAALTLAEVARADRLQPFLTAQERAALVEAGSRYLSSVRDYRGYDVNEGWRHGVAHAADLLMQLTLNPAVDKAQLARIVMAVQSMVAPPGEHFLVYGEGERLVRPVLFAARRGLLDAAFWTEFVAPLATPGPYASWGVAAQSQAGLARLHNLKGFLNPLYFNVREGGDAAVQAVLGPPVLEALKKLP